MQNPQVSSNCTTLRHQIRIIPCGLWGGTAQSLPSSWIPGSLTAALSINIIQSMAWQLHGSLHSGQDLMLGGGQQVLTLLRNHLTGLTGNLGASSQGWALLPTREKSVGNNLHPNRAFIALFNLLCWSRNIDLRSISQGPSPWLLTESTCGVALSLNSSGQAKGSNSRSNCKLNATLKLEITHPLSRAS